MTDLTFVFGQLGAFTALRAWRSIDCQDGSELEPARISN